MVNIRLIVQPYWEAVDQISSTFWACYLLNVIHLFLMFLVFQKMTCPPYVIFMITRGTSWWNSAVTHVLCRLAAATNNYISTVEMSRDAAKFAHRSILTFHLQQRVNTWLFWASEFVVLLVLVSLRSYLSRLHPPRWCCCCLMIPGDQRQTVSLGSAHTYVLNTHEDTHHDTCCTQSDHRPVGGVFLRCYVKPSQNQKWLQSTKYVQLMWLHS